MEANEHRPGGRNPVVAIVLALVPLVYVLSVGPFARWGVDRFGFDTWMELYLPLWMLADWVPPFGKALLWYFELWRPPAP